MSDRVRPAVLAALAQWHPVMHVRCRRGEPHPVAGRAQRVPLSQGGQNGLENLESLCDMHHSQEAGGRGVAISAARER